VEIKRATAPVLMPIYSREVHEPVPDALEVGPETPIVIVEGNYLLCDLKVWRSIATLCDIRIFVNVPLSEAKERVITRHVLGGLTLEEAEAKYERNDRPNSELIWPSKKNAEIIFEVA
jgi:pantothenate kinase